MRHKKDCYLVVPPADYPGLIVVGNRLVSLPADDLYRVYSLHAGKEYGKLVYIGNKNGYTLPN